MREDLDIAIHVGGLKVDPGRWRELSLGGSETAGLSIAEALARIGHHVVVFCNTELRSEHRGVIFVPLSSFPSYAASVPHDVLVAQRNPALLTLRTNARLNLLWAHDQASPQTAELLHSCLWNLDKCLVVSEFQKRQYQQQCGELGDLYYVTRNGVECRLFAELDFGSRRENEIIYGARPERGLDILLEQIMPRIWERRPDVVLKVCTYDFTDPRLDASYRHIRSLIDLANARGERVRVLGALSKRDLYQEYARSAAYVYPTPSPSFPGFREVSCISAMESMAAGLPVVTSPVGALPETLADGSASFVEGTPGSVDYNDAFANAVVTLLADPDRRAAMGHRGREHAKARLDWDLIAREWHERFWHWLDERNNERRRLAHHMIWSSDIIPARAVVATMPQGSDRLAWCYGAELMVACRFSEAFPT